jgi:exopolysaccharide biosynthesis polyprenyl glycosylphosphotransferase
MKSDLSNSIAVIGDLISIFVGLCLGYWLRFRSGFIPQNIPFWSVGQDISKVTLFQYFPLIGVGTILLIITFSYQNLYKNQHLLRYRRVTSIIIRSIAIWLLTYLGVSLAMKFEPPISRVYVITSALATTVIMLLWRLILHRFLKATTAANNLRQRVVFLGWTEEAERLAQVISTDEDQPYQVIGFIKPPGIDANNYQPLTIRCVGDQSDIEDLLTKNDADILILADLSLGSNQIVALTNLCARLMIQFKVIPSYFQILISGLTLETVSGVPILGVDELPLERVHNRVIKRGTDIAGALVGLIISAPIIFVFGALIYLEDRGPIFFGQDRVGRLGKPFRMYKLRSMQRGSEKTDHLNQSTQRHDARLLKIGSLIRRWNIDEVPQFWNVLTGNMSLVGPRPERLFHSWKLADEIPHYNARYSSKPGLTGWAQVNGLRGDTDLAERVRYDLFYLENWSVWLDFQIMVMTLISRKNAY